MKFILYCVLFLPLLSFGQEAPVSFLEDMREQSKADLIDIVGEKADEMVPLSASVRKGKVYVTWGYHRGQHTRSDVTFKTPDGTFTIHNVLGVDRPSNSLRSYIDPTKFTQPQYNLHFVT